MIIKRPLIVVTFILTLIGMVTLGMVHASNSPSPDQPSYTVEQRPDGSLIVRVQIDLMDRVARDRYAAQQRAEALALARSGTGRVPVQVTFAHPLSVEELRLLTQRTGLVADLVIFEARDASYGLHTVAARGTGVDVIDLGNLAPGLDSRGLRLVGATAVRGIVPASGLAQLATDERVYLPDVTPHRLAVEVAARYGVSVDKVQVSVPTPHWYISAGR